MRETIVKFYCDFPGVAKRHGAEFTIKDGDKADNIAPKEACSKHLLQMEIEAFNRGTGRVIIERNFHESRA